MAMPTKKIVKITPEVERILRRAQMSDSTLVLREQLDRKVYDEVNKVIVALGGKWNRGAKAHVFHRPFAEVLAEALDDGEVLDEKKTYDVYETPDAVIERMLGCVRDTHWVQFAMEPSAGSGRLVKALRIRYPLLHISAVEIRDCVIGGEPDHVIRSDFLEVNPAVAFKGRLPPGGSFDLIFANPPFSNGLDVKHVSHMLRFARPKDHDLGVTRLVTIMSPSYSFNGKKESVAFRRWLGRRQRAGGDVRVIQLPEGTFAEMGTDVRSHLIALDVTQDDRMELEGYLRELRS